MEQVIKDNIGKGFIISDGENSDTFKLLNIGNNKAIFVKNKGKTEVYFTFNISEDNSKYSIKLIEYYG